MRKTYNLTSTVLGVTETETTFYRVHKEVEAERTIVLTTFIKSFDAGDCLAIVAKDIQEDPLIELYLGNGEYDVSFVSLKSALSGTKIYITLKGV